MSFIRTGFRELGLKVRRQKTRFALRHEKRLLQKSEINLGREGTAQAANVPGLRNEIVALRKLEQEQKEVALRIAQIEEGVQKIEAERQQNATQQSEAIAKQEVEKKPILQRRNEAKSAADLCDRELAGVERRIDSNDAADRELLKELTTLQAVEPAPADLDTKTASLSARRARLPAERAELARARLGSAEACRLAKEKLIAADADLAAIEKNIERVRNEFETKDRSLNESMRAQQEAIKGARAQHQTVEERKNPAYLNIGRHLASQGIAPPNAPQLLTEVERHRGAVDRHLQHSNELAQISSQIDKQELRKFYFTVISVLALSAIILPLVSKSPARREWLPQETETIVSLNIDRFEKDDLPKRWGKEQADTWGKVWSGLLGPATATPILNLSRDAAFVTRGIATDSSGKRREFILVETRAELAPVIRSIAEDKSFERRTVAGLAIWQRPDLSVARIGSTTLAVGPATEVNDLVEVRLGMKTDLKTTGQFFDRFESLDRESALRVISREPAELSGIFHPFLPRELLDASQLLGLSLTLQNPVRGRLLVKVQSAERATQLARELQEQPQRLLRLPDSDLLLYIQPPQVDRQDANLEIRFDVPDNVARLLLQRLAKIDTPAVVAAQPSDPQ